MNILMISLDKGLLGGGQLGDAVERHRAYGAQPGVDRLDVIVLCLAGRQAFQISDNVQAYPTNSRFKLWYLFDAVRVAKKLFQTQGYDLVVTQDPFATGLTGVWLKRKHGSKLLVHCHGDYFENPWWLAESFSHWFQLLVAGWVVRRADAIRTVSQGIAEKLERLGIPTTRVRVIPTPVATEKFTTALPAAMEKFKRELGLTDAPMLLHVGRPDQAKDYPTLWQALAIVAQRVSPLQFVQIGAGFSPQQIQRQIGASSDKLSTAAAPRLPHDQLVAAYHLADIVVSSSRHESFGKVLVEANAAGRPVVATTTTGANDIIHPGVNGELVPVGDADALAEKIVYLLAHPMEAKAMGERGQALVAERFNGQKNTQAIVQFWREICFSPPYEATAEAGQGGVRGCH